MDTQLDAELRANILVEALPYIQEYYGQTVVVKYGGNAMINEELKDAVIHDLVLLNLVGVKVVIVHGGGPEINEMLGKIGKERDIAPKTEAAYGRALDKKAEQLSSEGLHLRGRVQSVYIHYHQSARGQEPIAFPVGESPARRDIR